MAQAQAAQREDVELAFKRFILTESADYASEPAADLFRVNLLGRMLDRYDELLARSIDSQHAQRLVKREFSDIARMMQEQDFDLAEDDFAASRWPQMSEDDAAQYIEESDKMLHKTAMGTAMCSACVLPLMIGAAFGTLTGSWRGEEFFASIGLVGMFIMIGLGVYAMTTAKKPKMYDTVKRGRYSLGSRVRRKLHQLKEAVDEKVRRRRGKGIALLVGCVSPILIGAAFDALAGASSGTFASFGVAGMFALIGLGVYEVVMAQGQKKTIDKLLDNEDKR